MKNQTKSIHPAGQGEDTRCVDVRVLLPQIVVSTQARPNGLYKTPPYERTTAYSDVLYYEVQRLPE